jgi:hypothetical protein
VVKPFDGSSGGAEYFDNVVVCWGNISAADEAFIL